MPQSKTWIVTTSADRPIKDVANDLNKAGFTVKQVLEEIGSITGAAAAEAAERARSIAGVVDVSEDVPVDVGPPDSPTSW
jgi:hypothetical protein